MRARMVPFAAASSIEIVSRLKLVSKSRSLLTSASCTAPCGSRSHACSPSFPGLPAPARLSRLPRASHRSLALLEIGGGEVEIRELHRLVFAEADALQLRGERRRIADEHDRQVIRLQVEARDPLDVVDGH